LHQLGRGIGRGIGREWRLRGNSSGNLFDSGDGGVERHSAQRGFDAYGGLRVRVTGLACGMGPQAAERRGWSGNGTGYTLSSGHSGERPDGNRQARNGETQGMTAKVTVEDVERVAELAHLELTPEETPRMLNDLNAILDQVAELNELDTAGVMPLAQVSELLDAAGAGVLRGDVLLASLDRATVLAQAPETDQVFFKVPKVIER
jgi:aspartyl-tRNA(Asn)/glutamyl-tRNA(Gln) amidotransferase subunit C